MAVYKSVASTPAVPSHGTLLLILARPTFWPMLVVPFVFGYLARPATPDYVQLALMVIWYCFWDSMTCWLNELSDRVEDQINQPERARLLDILGAGLLDKLCNLWTFFGAAAVFSLWVWHFGGAWSALLCALSICPVVLYSRGPRLKAQGVAAAVLGMYWTFMMLFLSGYQWGNPTLTRPPVAVLLPILLFHMLLQAGKDVPDVEGDLGAGIRNGFRGYDKMSLLRRAAMAGVLYFIPLGLIVGLVLTGYLQRPMLWSLALLPVAAYVWLMLVIVNVKDKRETFVMYQLNFLYLHMGGLFLFVLWNHHLDAMLAAAGLATVRLCMLALRLDPRFYNSGTDWASVAAALGRLNRRMLRNG